MVVRTEPDPLSRVLVACVGNQLRGDDGFGVAVAAQLQGSLPDQVDLIETGIGGLAIVQQLMEGYSGLIVVDAIERSAPPGTVFVLIPQVPKIRQPTMEEWQGQYADLHLAEPSRILRIAQAASVLPDHVLVVGCQPATCEDFHEGLSADVAAAVPIATGRVHELVDEILSELGRRDEIG
ncbi:MAG: hydrogenase maturation protease [Actinomycetota bacterium]|nr:hydrogenase maturation protease [Actinomycetota bacterium]